MENKLNQFFLLVFLFSTLTCANLQNLKLDSAPAYTHQTSWLNRQYATQNEQADLSLLYTTRLDTMTSTHYHFSVAPQDQPQQAYIVKIRRSDLAIDGFLSNKKKELDIYLPLLRFPLFKGKKWQETLLIQGHPRNPAKEIPASFEVKEIVNYNYVPGENLPAEKKAFLIVVNLPDQVFSYHYIPPSKKFPGTNPIGLYLQMDFSNTNAPRMENEVLEYMR